MKALILLIMVSLFLSSCDLTESDTAVDIEVNNTLKGVEITRATDKYDQSQGLFHIRATIKRTGYQHIGNLQLKASYYDAIGNKLAESKVDPENEIKPGDSDDVETTYLFPTTSDLPTRVVLTADDEWLIETAPRIESAQQALVTVSRP
jgi:predicted membrane-bound spermidine synthase